MDIEESLFIMMESKQKKFIREKSKMTLYYRCKALLIFFVDIKWSKN